MVQIHGLLEEFVVRRKWTGEDRFRRALGVYQVLPGPEAHEMCCYLGTVRGGRWGGVAAGLGFMLPGLLLMLVASALYGVLDLTSPPVAGALAAMQIAACALIVRAVFKLVTPIWTAASDTNKLPMLVVFVASIVWVNVVEFGGGLAVEGAASTEPRVAAALFGHGLVAGLVTFGGAYTALPYVSSVAAGDGGWMTQQACLDGIAIASVLPAPLVIFGTFVGYQGGGIAGALAFTAGIFLPAFSFTFLGFGFFERLVSWKPARKTLDFLSAVAVGLIAGAAILFMIETSGGWPKRSVFFGGWTAPLIGLAIGVVFRVKHRLVAPVLVIGAGAAGAIAGLLA
ncbi:MAG: chromate transporter [Planctomycetaceae bacterium]|nr:chromate transporter [Planctomycetaceae bacterium]